MYSVAIPYGEGTFTSTAPTGTPGHPRQDKITLNEPCYSTGVHKKTPRIPINPQKPRQRTGRQHPHAPTTPRTTPHPTPPHRTTHLHQRLLPLRPEGRVDQDARQFPRASRRRGERCRSRSELHGLRAQPTTDRSSVARTGPGGGRRREGGKPE